MSSLRTSSAPILTTKRPRVLFATAECVPFSKVGGLADVSQALPHALADLGAKLTVISPLYGNIRPEVLPDSPELVYSGSVHLGQHRQRYYEIILVPSKNEGAPRHYLVKSEDYFSRKGVYEDEMGFPYWDNGERFIFFQKVILELLQQERYDILHLNDHHTALLPLYVKQLGLTPKTVLTIHNIGYQGSYQPDILNLTDLGWKDYYPGGPLEFHGRANFLKAGIEYADVIATVSPGYARELLASSAISFGLDGVLRAQSKPLYGILNGVDYTVWSPEQDRFIPTKYSRTKMAGKKQNREALLRQVHLPKRSESAVVGIISRLVDSKGFELLMPLENELMQLPLQWVILGSGEDRFEQLFQDWSLKYPERVMYANGYDEPLSHLIEAGADLLLMPSKYEACGLNQIYSLRYGTIPIVHHTGGLGDTVQPWNGKTGTGFTFLAYKPFALMEAIERALLTLRQPKMWRKLMQNAMRQDFSWIKPAQTYLEIYSQCLV